MPSYYAYFKKIKFTWFSIRFSLRTGQARSFVKLLPFLKKLFFVVLTGCFGFNFFFCLGLVWFLLVLVSFTCSRYNFLLKGKLVLISGFSQGLVRSFNLGTWTQPTFTCSNLTRETLEQGVKYVFIVNFEHILHLVLVFLLLTLNKQLPAGKFLQKKDCFAQIIP